MGGIGLSSIEPQPNTTHTCTHTHVRTYIRINNHRYTINTCTDIYAQRTTIQQYSSPQHLVQYRTEHQVQHNRAHNMHTICSTIKTTQRTTQNNALVHTLFTYIVLIFMMNTYISKNTIYKLYTNYIHFARLIDEVSKITNIDILK